MEYYTENEKALMKTYETRTGTKLMSEDEKLEAYRLMSQQQRRSNWNGITRAIDARTNLDNADAFDGEDDGWKLKLLRQNLELIMQVERK